MAISRIPGYSLLSDLDRQGVDLQFTTSGSTLTYLDFANFRLGVNTSTPRAALDVVGNVHLSNLSINGNTISSDTGAIYFGTTANVIISGGSNKNVLYTDGSGNLSWGNIIQLLGPSQFDGNNIILGTNTQGTLVSNAVTMTMNTAVTDSIALLNQVLGKLVPPSPPAFPNNTTLLINGLSTYRMCNFTQTNNTGNAYTVTGGTIVSNILRTSSYSTNTITDVGPGNSGNLAVYLNGTAAGTVALTGTSNGTYSNLVISSNQDYHNVVSSVTTGFWFSVSASASGTARPGWNDVNINHTGVPARTNNASWYYDSSNPGTPTFISPNIYISSASLTYSSTIPHYNSSTTANIKFSVTSLSGDTFPTSNTFVTGSSSGAFTTPTSLDYSQTGVTYPLARNLYVSSGNVAVYTSASIISGFGSSSNGPSLYVTNGYNIGTQVFSPGNVVLYKTGTTTNIEETSIPVTNVGAGSGNAYRILNPGSTDTPTFTGSEAAFNSQSSTLTATDATVVAAVLKFDQTNYTTGYWPPGPNLTSHSANQYFTFKFVRTVVSKFDIVYTGSIAGLWVAVPGSTFDTSSTLNGWLNVSVPYAGAGAPGAGTGGNGSNGCALSGAAILNSYVTKAVTVTFGTVSSSSSATNEIYIRIKLTSGQSVSALSIAAASH